AQRVVEGVHFRVVGLVPGASASGTERGVVDGDDRPRARPSVVTEHDLLMPELGHLVEDTHALASCEGPVRVSRARKDSPSAGAGRSSVAATATVSRVPRMVMTRSRRRSRAARLGGQSALGTMPRSGDQAEPGRSGMTTMWDPVAEAMSVDQRAEGQSRRLGALVRRLTGSSPFYREKLAGAGVAIDAEVGLDDLASLPFTVKQDLWDHYPWGMLTIPRDQVVRVHASSGTGGRPSLVGYSRADLAIWAEVNARALGCASAVPGTVTHVAYGYGLFTGGLGLHGGAELMGCTVVPASAGQSGRQVRLLRDLAAEILCCTPSHAARLGEGLGEEGIDPR